MSTAATARRSRGRHGRWAVFFLAPSFLPLALFTFFPMAKSVWMSLHSWNLISAPTWVGVENYKRLLSDPATIQAFWHTLLYVLGYLPLVYCGGLALALVLNTRLPARGLLRAVYFLPVITSWVVVALVWKWILNPSSGVVNTVLGALGLPEPGWWTDPPLGDGVSHPGFSLEGPRFRHGHPAGWPARDPGGTV